MIYLWTGKICIMPLVWEKFDKIMLEIKADIGVWSSDSRYWNELKGFSPGFQFQCVSQFNWCYLVHPWNESAVWFSRKDKDEKNQVGKVFLEHREKLKHFWRKYENVRFWFGKYGRAEKVFWKIWKRVTNILGKFELSSWMWGNPGTSHLRQARMQAFGWVACHHPTSTSPLDPNCWVTLAFVASGPSTYAVLPLSSVHLCIAG